LTTSRMSLGTLLGVSGLSGDAVVERARVAGAGQGPLVGDIVMNVGDVVPGSLFACVRGARVDGHLLASEAVERGAVAVLCERPLDLPVAQVRVPSTRRALGPLCAAFWSFPSSAMNVVGVTGTNGKTTTCALLASVFRSAGWEPGVIGTLTGQRTTPEAPDLQRLLGSMRDRGARAVAMEVSSHALDQARVSGTDFAAAIFTNLSQDHLDYHGTMEAYFEAKLHLFTGEQVGLAVVNRADPWGSRLLAALEGHEAGRAPRRVVTFAPEDARDLVLGQRSAAFTWRGERLEIGLGGHFNVANALAAATAARELGVEWPSVVEGLATAAPVKGRFEPVDEGQPFHVLVDFAHTPAALAEALRAARELTGRGEGPDGEGGGRVIVVFGAGGQRDRGKRPQMGKVAGALADVVVLTSDNPRGERPLTIIEEIAGGLDGVPLVDADRASAIAGALAMARPGDVVLLAGKGHETTQDFGDRVEELDDVSVARSWLREHWAGGHRSGPGAAK